MRKEKAIKTIHVDGGAFIEPPENKFHDAFFTVCDDTGAVIYFAKNIGDVYSGLAEYEAIKWVIENIKERPLKITSDCSTAIVWSKKGSSDKSKYKAEKLNLKDIEVAYMHNNFADQWNEKNHSPKYGKEFYVKRYQKAVKKDKVEKKCPKCDGSLIERTGKFGNFMGCSNYPKCKHTDKI